MSESERANGSDFGIRVAGAFLPTVVTAHLLSAKIPLAFAWAISIFVWNLLLFVIPPKPHLKFSRWLLVTCVLSVLAFLLATFLPNVF